MLVGRRFVSRGRLVSEVGSRFFRKWTKFRNIVELALKFRLKSRSLFLFRGVPMTSDREPSILLTISINLEEQLNVKLVVTNLLTRVSILQYFYQEPINNVSTNVSFSFDQFQCI